MSNMRYKRSNSALDWRLEKMRIQLWHDAKAPAFLSGNRCVSFDRGVSYRLAVLVCSRLISDCLLVRSVCYCGLMSNCIGSLVWYEALEEREAIADCSRLSLNRSLPPTKAATYESRFTIHRPTQMDSMTNMAAIQMIHTIQGPECRGGNEEQQIVRSRNACSHYAAGISARN